MISFANDYSEGTHPRIMELLMKSSLEQNTAYGKDVHSANAKDYIKKLIERTDVDIHFIPGGTQTNLLVISAFLRPHQGVIAAHTGHINVHETGAIEATGHKVIAMPSENGKLTPDAIIKAVKYHADEHMVKPAMVYISDTTELGTIYSKNELIAIKQVCDEYSLLLYLDGARLGSALTCKDNDLTLKDIALLTDVFYIGGTKNGALLGEALVIGKENMKEDFRYLIKQRGAMLAKGFVIGMQFEALFQDRLYFEIGAHANQMADIIAATVKKCGYSFYTPACTNQLFIIFPDDIVNRLSEEFQFEIIEKCENNTSIVRFVTSWATTEENVRKLCSSLG